MKKAYAINAGLVLTLFAVITLLFHLGILNRFHNGLILLVCINIILAVSLNLSAGFLGQLVLGHAAFMAVGAYAAAIFSKYITGSEIGLSGTPLLIVALILGGLAAAVAGIIIGVPALRLRGDYIAIITLGFGLIVQSLINYFRTYTGGAQGLLGIPRLTNFNNAYFIVVITVLVLVCLIRSRHGRAMIAIREDEIAAEASGISTVYYKILGFTVSAFFAGVAGGLYAHYLAMLDSRAFGFSYSIELLVIVVLGGLGSFTGAIVAAVVLTLLPEILREFQQYRMLVYAIMLIAMMIFRPKGLMGTYEFSVFGIFDKCKKVFVKFKRKGAQ
ncbi:MAG: branched-chain amino acid ABC transporter permease [Clostridiales bacterium]|jgi:branched-chain amino acid transport system permease protein|nr:branched-chain amino acid ABC transporter permease [Clostridiales bacterium]